MKAKSNLRTPTKKDWHSTIAARRGATWRKNVIAGRRETMLNPSIIRMLRIQKGLDQKAFAEKLDVSPSTFGAIERAKQPVKKDKAEIVAGLLKVPVLKIFRTYGRKKMVAIIKKAAV